MSKGSFKAAKGVKDIFKDKLNRFETIEKTADDMSRLYGFSKIITPMFEDVALFNRADGQSSDVVNKEMFTFSDKAERQLALRPEGTAGVLRAAIENSLLEEPLPLKLYYFGPCFRNERPQAGRFKEFYQFGVELIGPSSYLADAEVILLADSIFKRLGVGGFCLKLNSLGCQNCSQDYKKALVGYLTGVKDKLCGNCKARLGKNPLRVLDCKNESCRSIISNAPKMLDFLCGECKAHFQNLKETLELNGVDYTTDPFIVRGLDYYNRTVFEFVSQDLGAQSAVCGGGRYDGLIGSLGGKDLPAVGFAVGVERLALIAEKQNCAPTEKSGCDIYIGRIGKEAQQVSFETANRLKARGIQAVCELMERGVKPQMRYADKIGAKFSCIIGDDELRTGVVKVKDMNSGVQIEVNLESFVDEFCKNMGKDR